MYLLADIDLAEAGDFFRFPEGAIGSHLFSAFRFCSESGEFRTQGQAFRVATCRCGLGCFAHMFPRTPSFGSQLGFVTHLSTHICVSSDRPTGFFPGFSLRLSCHPISYLGGELSER